MSRGKRLPGARNTWADKKLLNFYDGHNRKAGRAAADKAARSRRRRRQGRRFNRELVEDGYFISNERRNTK